MRLILVVLVFALPVRANELLEPVDYKALDPAVLVILADNMVVKLDELDAKHKRMVGHIDGEAPADEPTDTDKAVPAPNPLTEKPQSPHANLDKDTLVARCEELEGMIAAKESEIAEAGGAMGERFGGEVATVGDDSIYIEDGEWTVTIIENRDPDPSPLRAKIAEHESTLAEAKPALESAVATAKKEKTSADAGLISAKAEYDRMHVRDNVTRTLKSGHKVQDNEYRYSKAQRKPSSKRKSAAEKRAKAADKALKTAERKLALAIKKRDVQVGRLEREIEAMLRARELVVELDENGGKAIVLATQAHIETASNMQPESRYIIRGKGRFVPSGEEPGRITMKEAESTQ